MAAFTMAALIMPATKKALPFQAHGKLEPWGRCWPNVAGPIAHQLFRQGLYGRSSTLSIPLALRFGHNQQETPYWAARAKVRLVAGFTPPARPKPRADGDTTGENHPNTDNI
jgi:hypothetical protein